jgi:O-antigen/teichoic acid export membrane protein
MVRGGFLFAGLLALIAPEFIRLVIGEKWLPMLTAFRLMLLFTLLDPIKITIANLFVAVGKPEKILYSRLVQLAVMIIGLFVFGNRWGIAGVAIAVNLMLLVGIILLLWQAREFVQFSIRRLFALPAFALIVGLALARAAVEIPGIRTSLWLIGSAKTIVFLLVYSLLLLIMERDKIPMIVGMIKQARGTKNVQDARKII